MFLSSALVSFKLRIINFAEQHGNRAAEREFGVSESNVRLWRKSKENLEKMPRLKRANRGKKAAWPELEVDLLEWITEMDPLLHYRSSQRAQLSSSCYC